MSPEGGVLLMKTQGEGEAEVVRHLLETYGIASQVVSDITQSVSPFTVDGLGEVRIFVPADQLEEAKTILAEHRRIGSEMSRSEGEEGAGLVGEGGEEDSTPGPAQS